MYAFARKTKNLPRPLYFFINKITRTRNLAILLAIASTISVVATYFALTQSMSPFGPDPKKVLGLIVIDLVLFLGLAAIISKKVVGLIIESKKGSVGSRMQTRIVVMFSLVAIIPTITMAIFSLIFFNYGIQTWFDKKVSTAIEGSVAVAESYLEEHKKIISADILGMANDLNRDAYNIRKNPMSFSSKLSLLAGLRKLPEAIVFQKSYERETVLARTNLSFSLMMILEELSEDVLKSAQDGELVILTNQSDDRVIALVKLDNYFDSYLLVGRFVDNKILNHIEVTQGAANEYTKLKSGVYKLQIKFFMIFVIVALLLLAAVVWLGLIFAVALVTPVRGLIVATEKVKDGDLSARVAEGPENDEIATLGRAFNNMASQLEYQRSELISAQRRSAWSDVARRIAHEIKNPLTPIQLATDRLKRKYSKEVSDEETFNKYMDTISRNVASIGNMVEEFVSFARIPQPVFADNDICELVGDVIFSRETSNAKIKFKYNHPDMPIILNCDGNQISRVMTNLLKNSEESIQERMAADKDIKQGAINVSLYKDDGNCIIELNDNGKGFPDSIIEHLTEPYVTTKSKGTGLGLAIVKKIIEDHNGELIFSNLEGGACVYLSFPLEN